MNNSSSARKTETLCLYSVTNSILCLKAIFLTYRHAECSSANDKLSVLDKAKFIFYNTLNVQ